MGGIYRGAGGPGDATADASSEALLIKQLAIDVQADADAAAGSAAAAAASASTASTAATNAQTAETNAETAEANAETAEANAETAEVNAETAQGLAEDAQAAAEAAQAAAETAESGAATSATNAANSASAASTSASNASTSATNASNSASAAATSATNASNSATAAAGSATSASGSASAASSSASSASTSASNAATSETNAASSASTATTQAGIATTQATNASNSASAASTSASNAATSETNAASSASSASTSATNASNAQTAAESARDATLAAYDSFDDRYLGAKIADPVLDNDGNALQAGELYFNSVTGVMKVYTGTVWVAAYVSGDGVLLIANNLSDLASASTARTNLGLGTAATTAATDYATAAQGTKADTALQSSAIGSTVQAYDSDLTAFAGKTAPTGDVVGTSDTQTLTNKTINASQLVNNSITPAKMVNGGAEFGMRNRIINGAMVIDQRNAGASVTLTGSEFGCDRWSFEVSQSSKLSAQQNAGSVTPPVGFTKYQGITSLSSYSSTSTDYFWVRQNIEGFNTADLGWGTANAKTVTLGFWVYSSLTGTFSATFCNDSNNRSFPFSYSIPVANTWTFITQTVAGDTTGTWTTNNSAGIRILWNLGSGSTRQTTGGAWVAGDYRGGVTGSVSVVGTNGATFYITGVQLEVGTAATSFDYRPYGTELALCQRYYEKSYSTNTAIGSITYSGCQQWTAGSNSNSDITSCVTFAVEKRTEPTMTSYNPSTGASGTWIYGRAGASGTFTVNWERMSTRAAALYGAVGSPWVVVTWNGNWTASAEL